MSVPIILYIYLIGLLAVAMHLAWHMLRKLDHHDWHFHKADIWVAFALATLFWPLLLLKPKVAIDPRLLFGDEYGIAAHARELDRLRHCPPPCGSVVLYAQKHARYEETFGEFVFSALAVERALARRLREHPHLAKTDEGAMFNWVRARTEKDTITPVPDAWWEFQYVADDLIRQGEGTVRCTACDESFPTGRLIPRDERNASGWSFDRLHCFRGHPLLVAERIHITRASDYRPRGRDD